MSISGTDASNQPWQAVLAALAGNPTAGWTLKDGRTLAYEQAQGHLPPPLAAALREGRLAGQADAQLLDPYEAATQRAADLRALAAAEPTIDAHQFEGDDEDVLDFRAHRIRIVPEQPDAAPRLLVVWHDLAAPHAAERAQAQLQGQIESQQQAIAALRREVQEYSGRDGDTGLFDAEHFWAQLAREIDLSRREQRQFTLLLVELQEPRDTPAAAELVGRLLRTGTRGMDAVARLGGHRFGLILSGASLAPAYGRAETIRRQCAAETVVLQGAAQPCRLAIGAAAFPHHGPHPRDLIAACEGALADSLQRGGDCTRMAPVNFSAPAA